jgi:hypothetical protein
LGKIGEISEAKMIFDKIISLYPKKIESLLNYSWILNQCEKYDEIQKICDVILSIEPNNENAQKIKEITTMNASIKK